MSRPVVSTLFQEGYYSVASGWVEATAALPFTAANNLAWVWTLAAQKQQLGRKFPVAPQTLTDLSVTLRITAPIGGGVINSMTLYFINDSSFEQFDLAQWQAGFVATRREVATLSNTVLLPSQTIDVTFTGGQGARNRFNEMQAEAGWTGQAGFYLTTLATPTNVTVEVAATGDPAQMAGLLADETKTGLAGVGTPFTPDRVRDCPRCGSLRQEGEMIEDGYRRGLLVCEECWEPPERRLHPLRGVRRGAY